VSRIQIISEFFKVDLLISTLKKIALKAPSCVIFFKENYTHTLLPPERVTIYAAGELGYTQLHITATIFCAIEDMISKLLK